MQELALDLNGFTDLPEGKVAYVVTYLELREKAFLDAGPRADVQLERWETPDRDGFRALFREIGEEWLWFSRLVISDEELDDFLNDPNREVYVPIINGRRSGLVELNFDDAENPEIAFFGIIPSVVGGGIGRWLMANAIEIAWSRPQTKRLWLHTCTGDSPQAIHFYQSCGFKPFKRAIEVMDDPRLNGDIPRESARHVPIIG
ncbi:GNAT family N-acetyltransferase [Roseibium sp.]|uniref:GNAT family N-acetyltransferase n=1 Tax=Roseibium sp. TaxID=1936156 RepID=UPI003A96DC19